MGCVCVEVMYVTCLIQGLIAMPILIFLKSASLMPSCLRVCVEGVCGVCVEGVCGVCVVCVLSVCVTQSPV